MALALLPGGGDERPPVKTTEPTPLPNHCPASRNWVLEHREPRGDWEVGDPRPRFWQWQGLVVGGVWQRAPPGFPWTPPPVSYAVWPHGADRASGGWMDGRIDGQGDGTPKYIATLEASGRGATGMAPTSAPRGGGCQPAPMPHRGGCHPVPMPKRGLSPCPHASWGAATIQEPLRTTGTRPSLSPGGHRSPRTGQQHPGDAGTQGRAGGGCHLPGRPPALPPAPLHLRSSTPPGNCFY